MFPTYTRAERAADAAVHLAGVFFGLAGAAVLMFASLGRLPVRDVAGLGIYSAGLIGMFTASASYNLIHRPTLKEWLRRIDHAGIFVMIAGSYTPFALKIGGETGLWLLCGVWAIAIFGVVAKLAFPRRLYRISVALYLAQGWCILFAIGPLVDAIPPASTNLLIIGGVIYSAGVIFHLLERMPFHNVIWHVFVLGGAIAQYASIYGAVIAAPR
ncbi:MAG: hemolysin III family protein [Rhodomicrobiaceae bacterium]